MKFGKWLKIQAKLWIAPIICEIVRNAWAITINDLSAELEKRQLYINVFDLIDVVEHLKETGALEIYTTSNAEIFEKGQVRGTNYVRIAYK